MYISQTISKVNNLRVKSPTKANTDHHNGNLKLSFNLTLGVLLSVECCSQHN